MLLPELAPDHLILLAFGPGKGELILVRVPPDGWMVVDGCGAGRVDYAMKALAYYQARPRIVVLTHPHDDHSRGLARVIESATPRDRKEVWPRIGMVLPPGDDVSGRSAGFIAGVTRQAIAAVEARWSASPACRWDVNAGDLELLGDATLRVLSPRSDVREKQLGLWQAREPFDRNVISTALLLTWRGRRILLGSDLVEDPGDGWSHSLVLDPELGDHDLLKVPHHGSSEALHDEVLRPRARVPVPLRIFTPYSSSRLPRFSVGEGAHRVVSHGGTSYLTGLPRPHVEQSGRVEARALAELATHDAIAFDPMTAGFPDCYVLVSIPPDGGAPRVVQGPGSVLVVR
ncbi:MBL fold metallo-hydrolase [Sorangium cellulosum]|uniref:MBL fold metallo-hydrolase n=1 Tax=Sorangium cellulosum TaxID=56 RepID=UPI0012FFA791|nr:MBL fold metallo-hydrolase [Sorangium cellulosum]